MGRDGQKEAMVGCMGNPLACSNWNPFEKTKKRPPTLPYLLDLAAAALLMP
jgi:hypothetical protein